MGTLTITNKTLEKYFSFILNFDTASKKKLIVKLKESIKLTEPKKNNLNSLFGSWEDSKSADEIIKEIRNSRIESKNNTDFS